MTEGKNALLMAPTGTGKTEAAVLPIIDRLIREGATLIRGVDDVLEALSATPPAVGQAAPDEKDGPAQPDLPPPAPPPELEGVGRRVWEFLADAPRHVDNMAQELGVAVPELSRTLMLLEMKKLIRRLPGNQYERR